MGKAFVFELLPNQKPSLKSTNEFKSIGDFITHADAAGCYTTMRTCASSKILSFEQHVARLTKFGGLPFADEGEFAAVLIETLASLQQEDSWQPEQKICVTVGHNTLRKVIMGIFLENLTSLCNSKVIALFHPTRHEPSVKSTDWVSERKEAIRENIPPYEEVVIVDVYGKIYEGLSSNFAIITHNYNVIETAPFENVLMGTILKLILDEAAVLGVQVVQKFPNVFECEFWKGCFICSTSRLLLPIASFSYYEKNGQLKEMQFDVEQEIYAKINAMLRVKMQTSVALF